MTDSNMNTDQDDLDTEDQKTMTEEGFPTTPNTREEMQAVESDNNEPDLNDNQTEVPVKSAVQTRQESQTTQRKRPGRPPGSGNKKKQDSNTSNKQQKSTKQNDVVQYENPYERLIVREGTDSTEVEEQRKAIRRRVKEARQRTFPR